MCLIGASGSGKSTLLRFVNLLEAIEQGRLLLWGEDLAGPGVDRDAVRRWIGIVFQSYNLFPRMTVLRNVTLAPVEVLGKSRKDAAEEAHACSSTASASPTSSTTTPTGSPEASSSASPTCVPSRWARGSLLDEVTSALDPELVAEVLDVIRELAGAA